MGKTIDKVHPLWFPWEATIMHSGYGMVWARAWTQKGAKRKALRMWGELVTNA